MVLAHSEYLIPVIPTEAGFNCRKRQREYETLWQSGGWCFYGSFADLLTHQASNETLAAFVRDRIRERVRRPRSRSCWCRVMVQASEFCDPYQIECA